LVALKDVYGFPRGNELTQALDFLIYSIDLALVPSEKRVHIASVEPIHTQVGEIPASRGEYFVVGFPSSGKAIDYAEKRVQMRRAFLTGRYDRWDRPAGYHRLNLDALPPWVSTLGGMSGSPVFLRDPSDFRMAGCRLVGMLVTGGAAAMNVGFIDTNRILEFLDCLV